MTDRSIEASKASTPSSSGQEFSEFDPLIDKFVATHPKRGSGEIVHIKGNSTDAWKQIVASSADDAYRLVMRTAHRALRSEKSDSIRWLYMGLAKALIRPEIRLSDCDVQELLLWHRIEMDRWAKEINSHPGDEWIQYRNFHRKLWEDWNFFRPLLEWLEQCSKRSGLTSAMRQALTDFPDANITNYELSRTWTLLGRKLPSLHATDVWTCRALGELKKMPERQADSWFALLAHCGTASSGKPTAKWLKTATQLIADLGEAEFRPRLVSWLPLTGQPRQTAIAEHNSWFDLDLDEFNSDVLKGLVWCLGLLQGPEILNALTDLATISYRKIPIKGPRAPKIGNAALWALGYLPGHDGAGALAILRRRIKSANVQKLIDAALTQVAEREGMHSDDVEELTVPAYGMEAVGMRTEQLDDFIGELRVLNGKKTELHWRNTDGGTQKSVPAAVQNAYAEELKDMKQAAQDIPKQLTAQKERLDRLFVQQKQWPYQTWRERYFDHPLVGILVRRLIWCFESNGVCQEGFYFDDELRDREGQILDGLDGLTLVTLWHPLNSTVAEVLAWREWLEARQITQPMKQAHREVYLLTDAERTSRIYSNRFAAHILKQHQFNALCATRGWRNRLLVSMEEDYSGIAIRELPDWNLRAEYHVCGGGEYASETNDAGVFLHVATDQLRFYSLHTTEPLPLEQVPPRVLSEIMRDVDLFVGVAGVGNDPTWQDNGAETNRNYWNAYAFGPLNETAKTRHDVLSRLLPSLKIGSRCTLTDRFLEVQGDLRKYRIHLGSANILMAPNDQYLCIVTANKEDDRVFLPFEGDTTLSVIISKAFLLANDKKISDPTILSQIQKA